MENNEYPTERQLLRFEAETAATEATEDMTMGPWCPAPDQTDDDGNTVYAIYVWDTCEYGPPDSATIAALPNMK